MKQEKKAGAHLQQAVGMWVSEWGWVRGPRRPEPERPFSSERPRTGCWTPGNRRKPRSFTPPGRWSASFPHFSRGWRNPTAPLPPTPGGTSSTGKSRTGPFGSLCWSSVGECRVWREEGGGEGFRSEAASCSFCFFPCNPKLGTLRAKCALAKSLAPGSQCAGGKSGMDPDGKTANPGVGRRHLADPC